MGRLTLHVARLELKGRIDSSVAQPPVPILPPSRVGSYRGSPARATITFAPSGSIPPTNGRRRMSPELRPCIGGSDALGSATDQRREVDDACWGPDPSNAAVRVWRVDSPRACPGRASRTSQGYGESRPADRR